MKRIFVNFINEKRAIIYYLLFSIMPLLAACIYCLISQKCIGDIYLPNVDFPNGDWTDEVSYYKQIEGIIEYGIPRGFFAYNDSAAAVGTMGPWSFLLFIPYVIVGKIIGWTYITHVACNIFFVCVGFFLFALISKKKISVLVTVGVIICANPIFIRYMLSGMAEPVFYMFMLVYGALILRMWDNNKTYIMIIALMLGMYLSIIRPYCIILMIIPAYHLVVRDKRYIILSTISMIVALIIYFVISQKFCAPYFMKTIDLGSLEMLKEGHIFSAIKYVFKTLINQLIVVAWYIKQMFLTGEILGEKWIYYFVALIFLIINCFTNKNEKREHFILLFAVSMIVMLAVLIFYSANMGSRHMMVVSIIMILAVAEAEQKILLSEAVILLLLCIAMPKTRIFYQIPYKTENAVAYVKETEKLFSSHITVTEKCSWDNSVMWIMSDWDENKVWYDVPYNILYALPAGIGISTTQNTYILQNGTGVVKSKYIITPSHGMVSDLIKESGADLLESNDVFSLWKNAKYFN